MCIVLNQGIRFFFQVAVIILYKSMLDISVFLLLLTCTLYCVSHRARDLGTQLSERYSSGTRPSEGEVLELIEQLSVIESDLDISSEHISEGTAILTKMISSSHSEYQYSTLIAP